jgi:hypothetical protein
MVKVIIVKEVMTGDIFWFSIYQNAKKSIRDACTADNFQTRQGVSKGVLIFSVKTV